VFKKPKDHSWGVKTQRSVKERGWGGGVSGNEKKTRGTRDREKRKSKTVCLMWAGGLERKRLGVGQGNYTRYTHQPGAPEAPTKGGGAEGPGGGRGAA